jgi:hypothetical protein
LCSFPGFSSFFVSDFCSSWLEAGERFGVGENTGSVRHSSGINTSLCASCRPISQQNSSTDALLAYITEYGGWIRLRDEQQSLNGGLNVTLVLLQ